MRQLDDHELDQVSGGAGALVRAFTIGIMYDLGRTLFFRAGGHLQYYLNVLDGAAVEAKWRLWDQAYSHQFRA